MARKLKVFQAQFGFHDSVVAAPSRAAALRAWGTHRDLFADGGAREATDPTAIAAALEQPEVPLRRAVGSDDPFSLNPRLPRLPDLPDVPVAKLKVTPVKAQAKPVPPPRPPPDRSALDAAALALKIIDDERRVEEHALAERRAALEAEERGAQQRYVDTRAKGEDKLRREQQAYTKAGGRV